MSASQSQAVVCKNAKMKGKSNANPTWEVRHDVGGREGKVAGVPSCLTHHPPVCPVLFLSVRLQSCPVPALSFLLLQVQAAGPPLPLPLLLSLSHTGSSAQPPSPLQVACSRKVGHRGSCLSVSCSLPALLARGSLVLSPATAISQSSKVPKSSPSSFLPMTKARGRQEWHVRCI